MTSKERVLAAIDHKTPDRQPCDLGGTSCSTIACTGYEALKKHLGIDKPPKLMMREFQIACVDDEVLDILGVDTRSVVGMPHYFPITPIDENSYYDNFGIKFRMPENGLYYDQEEHPLAHIEEFEELKDYEWPNPFIPNTIEGIKARAKQLYDENKYAIIGDYVNTGIFEPSHYLRGFENFLVDLMVNKDIAHFIMENMLKFQMGRMEYFLNEVGEYLDIVFVGDDLASSQSLLIHPDVYREMVKPYHKKYFEFIKTKTKAKLLYHSCGSIVDLIDDLIEIGVNILNPVQVSASGMDTEKLKERFGDRIAFWGGIDTTNILPNGTKEDVQKEVYKRIDDLGPSGYVAAAVHDIQADVKPENIVAMFEAIHKYR